jgi:hypothetical protein
MHIGHVAPHNDKVKTRGQNKNLALSR